METDTRELSGSAMERDHQADVLYPAPVAARLSMSSQFGADGSVSVTSRWEWFLVAVVTMVGAILRCYGLGSKSLWIDETFSIGMVRQDWGGFWHTVAFVQPNMELYYLLLKVSTSIVPPAWQTDAFWRVIPCLAGIAVIPIVYVLARRLFGSAVGIGAASLIAVNAFQIEYSQQARAYSLFVLIVTTSYLMLVRWIDGKRTALYWFSILTVLGFLTQAFEIVFLAAQVSGLVLVHLSGRRIAWRSFGVALIPIAIVLCVRYPLYNRYPDQVSWIMKPTFQTLRLDSIALIGGNSSHLTRIGPLLLLIMLICIVGLIVFPVVVHFSRRVQSEPAGGNWWIGILLMVTWAGVSVLGTFLGSQVKPVWVPRYLAPATVPLCVIIVAAIVAYLRFTPHGIVRTSIQVGVIILACIAWFIPTQHYLARPGWEDWRSAGHAVAQSYRSGDGIVCFNNLWGCSFGFDYYMGQVSSDVRSDVAAPGAFTWERYQQADRRVLFADALAPAQLDAYRRTHHRVWLLLGHYYTGNDDVKNALANLTIHARSVDQHVYAGDIQVWLFDFGG